MRAGLHTLLFPPKCTACGTLLRFEGFGEAEVPALCKSCLALWQSEKLETCGSCAKPVAECVCLTDELQKAHCEVLRKSVYYLHGKSSAVQNRLLYRIKNASSRRLTEFLAKEMSVQVKDIVREHRLRLDRTVLVYIPRSRQKALQVGTDQAKQLAYAISDLTELPVVRAIRRRFGRDKLQKRLGLRERRRNARLSYALCAKNEWTGYDVILIDDIVTTGSSMAAAARLLRSSGANRVFCLAVASDDSNKDPNTRQPVFLI